MRALRVAVPDRAEFLGRFDRCAARLRYRSIEEGDGIVVYEPRALLRTAATRLFVELRGDEAVVIGPDAALKRLAKEMKKSSGQAGGVREGPR